jgi:hypothetical protein
VPPGEGRLITLTPDETDPPALLVGRLEITLVAINNARKTARVGNWKLRVLTSPSLFHSAPTALGGTGVRCSLYHNAPYQPFISTGAVGATVLYSGNMEQRVSLVTLGVIDTSRAREFYEALGWTGLSPDGDVIFFQTGNSVLALWSRAQVGRGQSHRGQRRMGRRYPGAQRQVPRRGR